MKQQTKWCATTLAVAGGLVIASSAQAQYTTNTISDFHNFTPSATYANWDVAGSDPFNGGEGYTPTLTSGPTSFTVDAQGYGSLAFNLPTPLDFSGATEFEITFTINTTHTPASWFGANLDISDGTHMVHLTASNAGGGYLGYGPYSGPATYTLIGSLADQFGGADLDASTITAFNLEVDPATYDNTPYNITYQDLSLLTPTPEPATLALLAIGGAGLVIARRRSKAS